MSVHRIVELQGFYSGDEMCQSEIKSFKEETIQVIVTTDLLDWDISPNCHSPIWYDRKLVHDPSYVRW